MSRRAAKPSANRPWRGTGPRGGATEVDLKVLGQARQRAQDAYAAARRDVFDVYPSGVPSADVLTERQQAALDELRSAERDLDRLRRAMHDGIPADAAPIPTATNASDPRRGRL